MKYCWSLRFCTTTPVMVAYQADQEEETEILYTRRYKSQDEIETFLTVLLHLCGRSEKIMKIQ